MNTIKESKAFGCVYKLKETYNAPAKYTMQEVLCSPLDNKGIYSDDEWYELDFVNLDDDTLSSVLNELNQLFPQFDVKSVQQQINI